MEETKKKTEITLETKISDFKDKVLKKRQNRWLAGFIFFAVLFLVLNILLQWMKLNSSKRKRALYGN